MPITSGSEPRRKGSPRWFLVFWLVLIGFRVWSFNRGLAIGLFAVAAVLFLTGLRRTERPFGGPTTASPSAMPSPGVETIAVPPTPPDARPIEPDVGGVTGKLIVLAIVLLVLGLLVGFLFRSQGGKLTP